MNLTKNFTLDEFIESRFYTEEVQEDVWTSYDNDCATLEPNLQRLAENLQILRDHVGKACSPDAFPLTDRAIRLFRVSHQWRSVPDPEPRSYVLSNH